MQKPFITGFWLLLLFSLLGGIVLAQTETNGLSFDVQTGFDGYGKMQSWVPVTVHATNVGPDVDGQLQAVSDYPGETYAMALSLPSQSDKVVTMYVPLSSSRFTVRYVDEDNRELFEKVVNVRSMSEYAMIVGVISDDPGLLNMLGGLETDVYREPLYVAHLQLDDLPEQAAAFGAFDVLIFNDVDTAGMTPNQVNALGAWVRQGGRLVIGGGPNAAATLAGLAQLVPAADFRDHIFDDLPQLATYGELSIPNQGPYPAAVPQQVNGNILVTENGQPLLIKRSLGGGSVTYFALDFGLAPMNGWAGSETFWRKTLEALESRTVFHANYEAIRVINDGLADIPAGGLPSPWGLAGYLCAYFIFLVPVNYVVLRQMKKLHLAWITIPVLILVFSLIGYLAGFRTRGGASILRQISVISQPSGTSTAAVDAFLGVYAPRRETYNLSFDADTLVRPTEAGNGYKGIKDNPNAPTTIFFGPQTELQNLYTDIGGMSTLMAQQQIEHAPIEVIAALAEVDGAWYLSGLVNNQSDQTLQNVAIFVGGYGLQLSTLPPGQTEFNEVLQTLWLENYTDQTLWHESYYNVDDRQVIIDDQIIREVIWTDDNVNLNVKPGVSPTVEMIENKPQGDVILTGWSRNQPSPINVAVDKRVTHENDNLVVVTAPLGGE